LGGGVAVVAAGVAAIPDAWDVTDSPAQNDVAASRARPAMTPSLRETDEFMMPSSFSRMVRSPN
jgi:hypothetical protein